MKHVLIPLFFALIACSAHETKTGGSEIYKGEALTPENQSELSRKYVKTIFRDSPKGANAKIYKSPDGSIKRIGVMFFETIIQPTRGGLSTEENYYFNNRAKQIYTEKLYQDWITRIKKWDSRIETVEVDEFVKNKTFSSYIEDFQDYITKDGELLLAEDLQYLAKGKTTTMNNLMMPRKFKDLSLMSAPMANFIGGSKPSDYHKYWLNDVAKEMKLDALLIVYTEMDWSRQTTEAMDPKKIIPEGAKLRIEAAISTPFSRYQKLLKANGFTEEVTPKTIAFRAYEERAFLNVKIEKPAEGQSVKEAFDLHIWNQVYPAYTNMIEMMAIQMEKDLVGTL